MSKKIITLPNSHLRDKSERVHIVTKDTHVLIEKMEEATLEWENSRDHEVGVALAAVQIDELKRVIIIRKDFNDKTNTEFDVYINPEIIKYEGEIIEDFEGCLSIKNVYGKVPRYSKVRVKAKTIDGQEIKLKAEGFLARVFQHEIDHTNGTVFVDHIKDKPEKLYKLDDDGKVVELNESEREDAIRVLW